MSEDDKLEEIYRFLELNNVDGRVKLKADTMKKIIKLTSLWKIGWKQEWIDKLATRSSLSTRKIRENYIEPLITDGILVQHGSKLEFHGLPDGAEMPTELTNEQLQDELNEENANRIALGKKPYTMKQWKKIRKPRMMVDWKPTPRRKVE